MSLKTSGEHRGERCTALSCHAARASGAAALLGALLVVMQASLTGCVGSRLTDTAPPGYSLSGTWKLNPARSTDAAQALQQLRTHAMRHSNDADSAPVVARPGGPRQQGKRGEGDGLQNMFPPEPYPIDLSLQQMLLRGGDWLQIEQRDNELVIGNGDTTHSFTPGGQSVVSVPGGVADQRSGWKGKEYVIEIRPQVISLDPHTLGEVLGDARTLAQATDRKDAAVELVRDAAQRIDRVRLAVRGARRPRVVALEWLDPPFAAGHWTPQLIEYAGGEDVLGFAGERSEERTWEQVRVSQPDIVIVMPCGYDAEIAHREAEMHRDELAAIGAGEVVAVDAASYFSRPGPRIVDGLELLAHIIHPELVRQAAGAPLTVEL